MTAERPAAILDLDGTLVDSNYHHALAWFRALREQAIVMPLWRLHRHIGMGGLPTVFRDVYRRAVRLTFATNPAGLSLRLDGQPRATPLTVTAVVGVERALGAPSPQTVDGRTYEFVNFSNGGERAQTITTPATDTTQQRPTEVANQPGR